MILPLPDRSEQALECEETAVASVAAAGPTDDVAAAGTTKFCFLRMDMHHVIVRYMNY